MDALLYPSVFILILFMLIGLLIPLPHNEDTANLRQIEVFVSDVVCFLAVRGFAMLRFRMNWI